MTVTADRRALALEVLAHGFWMEPGQVTRAAQRGGAAKMPAGTMRGILDQLADDGQIERRAGPGHHAAYRRTTQS